MGSHLFDRTLFDWPTLSGLASSAQRQLQEASSILFSASSAPCEGCTFLGPRSNSIWNSLEHELSWAMQDSWPLIDGPSEHTIAEMKASSNLFQTALLAIRSGSVMSLLQSFEDFARDVTGIAEPVREVGAIFSDENQSSRIRFAQAEIAQENLYSMFCKVVGNSELPPLLIATIAMVAINNCHPFYDGNGRTARWAFNLMIWSAGGNADCYIPLHDFFIRSRGGFLIRQRIAEKTGDWSELVEYLCRIIKFYFGDPSERSSRPV